MYFPFLVLFCFVLFCVHHITSHHITATPVGIIFNNTDLVHVGFPLNASSASHIKCLDRSFTTTTTTTTRTRTRTRTRANTKSKEKEKKPSYSSSFQCMTKYKNRWDTRDFSVPQDKLLHLLQQFVADVDVDVDVNVNKIDINDGSGGSSSTSSSTSSDLTCKDYQNLARDEYVIYNVMCSDNEDEDNNSNPSNTNKAKTVHHFYRDKEWGDMKTNCTICT